MTWDDLSHADTVRVEIKYRDPSYELDGELYFPAEYEDWQPGPVWVRGDLCCHTETMCFECIETWNLDHQIRLVLDLMWCDPPRMVVLEIDQLGDDDA